MKSVDANNLLSQIDVAMDNILGFSNATDLEHSYLSQFLVVFICGIYEEAIETILNEWA